MLKFLMKFVELLQLIFIYIVQCVCVYIYLTNHFLFIMRGNNITLIITHYTTIFF